MSVLRWLVRLVLGRRLPRTEGRLRVAGLHGPVTIHRERHGIPIIEAGSERDAFFGLGFCQGQDRTFQLELLLRVGRGTLAELVGPDALPIDRLSRRVGFHRAARAKVDVLAPEMREVAEAYAAGIRAGATAGLTRRPHEFVFLGGQPTPWTPADSLGVVELVSFSLSANWTTELARLRLWREDGEAALRALDPAFPDRPHGPPADATGSATEPVFHRLAEELTLLRQLVGGSGASNNWAIAASRTATGRPLLANDPHLDAKLPSPWYLAHLRYPGLAVVGASFVGGPCILAGHNGHAAWGLTAGLVDNTDLFLEQLGPDGRSYRHGDEFRPCVVHEERIAVKGKPAVVETVLETPRGPILTGALEGITDTVSLRALWLDRRPVSGLLRVHRARSFAEFRELLRDWPATSQNMVYADTTGTIGWQLAGEAPRRKLGRGALPLPAWNPSVGWEDDLLPYDQLPYLENPPEGYLATANTRPNPEGQGPDLGEDFLDTYRLQAIQAALAGRSDWTVAETLRLQTDQRTLAWPEMRDVILALPADTPRRTVALQLLRDWDGVLGIDSAAASVYEVLLFELALRVTKAKAPHSWMTALGQSAVPLVTCNFFAFRRAGHLARHLREQPAGWFAHGWPAEMADALEEAVARIEAHAGPDPRNWGWGRLRPLVLAHPLGRNGLLASIFNLGPFPHGGDCNTINQAAAVPWQPFAPAINLASVRIVIDVGAWSNSRFVIPAGQSGNPYSPHYADQLDIWRRGEGLPIPWTPEEIAAATCATLTLEPGEDAPAQVMR